MRSIHREALSMPGLFKVSDRAIYRCAAALVEIYPTESGPTLAALAQEHLTAGDVETGVFWVRLLRAVESLGALRPDPGALLH
jgi:hypothetical protein